MRLSGNDSFVQNAVRATFAADLPPHLPESAVRTRSSSGRGRIAGSLNPKIPMAATSESLIEVDDRLVDLRNRPLAALLAWLIPGGGHFYQRRYAKGTLYLVCILTLWIIGFSIGGFHVVYASRHPGDHRWHYYFQAGAGVIALPALVQTRHMNQFTSERTGVTSDQYEPRWYGFMAPPHRPVAEEKTDEVSAWYARHGAGYEMGTWYTMIAGLLNILVIYDAYAGPLGIPISGRKRKEDELATEPSVNAEQPA